MNFSAIRKFFRFANSTSLAFLVIAFCFSTTALAQTNTTWTGSAGNNLYFDPANWSNGVPNGNFNAFIDGGALPASTVNLNSDATIGRLDISLSDALNVNSGANLTITNSTIENLGTFTLNNSVLTMGANTVLNQGNNLFSEFQLNDGIVTRTGNYSFSVFGNVRGRGVIDAFALANSGTISANSSSGALQLVAVDDIFNGGILEARTGGTLDIFSNAGSGLFLNVENSNGIIQAGVGSQVNLHDGVKITGGFLQGGGFIQAHGTTMLLGVENRNLFVVADGATTNLQGEINNSGRIVLNSSGASTRLTVDGPLVTLSGGGSVELVGADSTFGESPSVNGLTLNTDNSIVGNGSINISHINNTGLIGAAGAGNSLTISPTGSLDNSGGILSASSGAILNLGGPLQSMVAPRFVQNFNGTIEAGNNSEVVIGNATVNGGVIRTNGNGVVRYEYGSKFSDVRIEGYVTAVDIQHNLIISGNIDLAENAVLHSHGYNPQTGAHAFDPGIVVDTNATITGSGEVLLNYRGGFWGLTNNDILTNNSSIRLDAGLGFIGVKEFNNNGLVVSQGIGSKLNVGNESTTNNGVMRADGGKIEFRNLNNFPNSLANYSGGSLVGGSWQAINGGTFEAVGLDVTLNHANILLAGAGSGFVDLSSNSNGLQNLQGNGTAGTLALDSGASLNTAFDFENFGNVNTAGSGTTFQIGNGTGDYRQIFGVTTVDGTLEASSVILDGGVFEGSGLVSANLINNGGILGPGNSPGELIIGGDFTQGINGTLQIELGGLTAGMDHDLLSVGGLATLDGSLDILFWGSYRPDLGDRFVVLQSSMLNGAFATINSPGNYQFDVEYGQEGFLALTVTSIPEPASFLPLIALGMALVSRRHRKKV